MANRVNTKEHVPLSLRYGAPMALSFGSVGVVASQPNTAAQAIYVLPIACKVPLVTLFVSSAASGITAFNIVVGSAAEAGVLVADNSDTGLFEPPTVNTTPGLSLYQAGTFPNFTGPQDQAVAIGAAYGTATYPTSEPDAIFPQGTPLTFRYVSGATVNGVVIATMLAIPVDIHPTFSANNGGIWTWASTNVG